jgi:MinD superfamily P-loop ATPase
MAVELKFIARLEDALCDGCKICLPACSYRALLLIPGEQVPMVDIWACAGCGTCVTTCPREALALRPQVDR